MQIHIFSLIGQDDTVAFTVLLEADVSPSAGEKVQYNQIVTNVGGAYVPERREFVCPSEGVYIFHSSNLAFGGNQCKLDFYKNEDDVARTWSDNSNQPHGQGGSLVVLELASGDTVSIRAENGCTMNGNEKYNVFSGFKV